MTASPPSPAPNNRPTVHTRLVARHKWMSLHVGYLNEPYVFGGQGIFVVPLNAQREVLFIIEPAIPDARPVLTLPAGAIDVGEDARLSANRELQEEAGYRAGRLDLLAQLNPLARHAVWDIYHFLARDLTPSRLPGDEAYTIETEWVPLDDFEQLIHTGRLTYASIIAALYLTRSFLDREHA